MNFRCPHFRAGVALTCFVAITAMSLNHFSFFHEIGALAWALLLGIGVRALLHIPVLQETGIQFSSKELLRLGTVLIGIKCQFGLLLHIGPKIVMIATSVVAVGMLLVFWLGRMARLSQTLSLLLAMDTSICGASAVASMAPTLQAKKEEVALVIPIGGLIGTLALIGMKAGKGFFLKAPIAFGVLAGASLQEMAQVVAASSSVPGSLEVGVATKFIRVLLLAPVVLVMALILTKRRSQGKKALQKNIFTMINSTWFVFGYLIIGIFHTLFEHFIKKSLLICADEVILSSATFFMAMAMAGVGLQIRLEGFWDQGLRVFVVAALGWFFLGIMILGELHFLGAK